MVERKDTKFSNFMVCASATLSRRLTTVPIWVSWDCTFLIYSSIISRLVNELSAVDKSTNKSSVVKSNSAVIYLSSPEPMSTLSFNVKGYDVGI